MLNGIYTRHVIIPIAGVVTKLFDGVQSLAQLFGRAERETLRFVAPRVRMLHFCHAVQRFFDARPVTYAASGTDARHPELGRC